jgi:hypothetical protein
MKQESLQKAGQPAAEVEKKRDHTELMADIDKNCATAFAEPLTHRSSCSRP